MNYPKILNYKDEKLEKKVSFLEGENGSFGLFYERFGHHMVHQYLGDKDSLVIFAANQNDFSNSKFKDYPLGTIGFQVYLNQALESSAKGSIKYLETRFGKRNYSGGKQGEYEFKSGILLIKPFWKWHQSEGKCKDVCGLLRLHPEFKLEDYKILEGINEVVI
jgi:hypothetical protein